MSTANSNITSDYYNPVILKKWNLQPTKKILNRNSLVILELKKLKISWQKLWWIQPEGWCDVQEWMHEHLKLVFRPKLTTTIWLSFHGLRKFSQAYQNLYHEKYNSCVVNIPIDMLWYIYHFPCFWMPILIFISERSGIFLFELNFSLVLDLLLTGCYEIFNSVVLDLSRRLLLVHSILRREPTACVSVGEKNINTARISMNS